MGRKVEIPVPSSDLFSIVRDFLLFKGDYTICFYVFLVLYCAACCRYLRKRSTALAWPASEGRTHAQHQQHRAFFALEHSPEAQSVDS